MKEIKEKRKLLIELITFLTVLLVLFVLLAYHQDDTQYKVSFITNTDQDIPSVIVDSNNCVDEPSVPQKDGYKFIGWYVNDKKYDFKSPVTKDLVIEAVFEKETIE